MKIMRKILALVLVVASLLSFSLIAGAATVEYTDASKITHAAAVDVLSAVGVINGYENGSFKPTSSVTRAEMAKILAFVLNGGEDVGESYVSACTFADSQNHWAKGYIGFCVSAGLINGKNANTFDPDGNVTGYEVSKMLLCALGYKADLNGLTGAQWNTTAHSLAIKSELLTDLQNYAPAKAMNRDDSCQMILNALQATMVETTGSVLDVAGMTIVQDVENTPLVQTGADYAGRVDGNQQLVEDLFPTLKLVSGTTNDAFGRPATEWRLKGASLGVYPMKPLLTSDSSVRGSAVAKAIGTATIKSADVFVNGKLQGSITVEKLTQELGLTLTQIKNAYYLNIAAAIYDNFGPGFDNNFYATVLAQVLNGYDATMTYTNSKIEDGSSRTTFAFHTEAFFDEATGKLTLINNNYYYGEVKSVRNPVTDAEGNVTSPGYILVSPCDHDGASANKYPSPLVFADIEVDDSITIPGGTYLPILLDDVNTGEDEESIKVGDYVVFNLGCTDRNAQDKTYLAENAKLMQRVTVTLAQTTQGASAGTPQPYDTIRDTDDVTYYAALHSGERRLHTVGETYDIIFATFGTRNYYYKTFDAAGSYMYLYDADKSQNTLNGGYVAKLVKSDGSVQIVQTDKLYKDIIGSVVTASTNAAGQTVLKKVGEPSGNINVRVKVENSNSTVTFDNVTMLADTNTRFVISQTDSNGVETFTTYTGIHKVPDIEAGQYYAYVTNAATGTLHTVFIINATVGTSTLQEGAVFKISSKDAQRTGEGGTYYELPAILNGQITTVKMTTAVYNDLPGDGFHLFNAYTTNAFGHVDSFTKLSGTAIRKDSFIPAEAGNISINGTAMTYHENVLVYTYSMTNKTLAASTVESLYELDYGTFTSYYTLHQTHPGKPLAAIFAIIP